MGGKAVGVCRARPPPGAGLRWGRSFPEPECGRGSDLMRCPPLFPFLKRGGYGGGSSHPRIKSVDGLI